MATLAIVNPSPRRRRRKSRRSHRRHKNPLLQHRRRRRRRSRKNPIPMFANARRRRRARRHRNPLNLGGTGRSLMGSVRGTVVPAAYAVAGAIGLDLAWGYLPIPDTFKLGTTRYLAKGAGAIAIGWLASKVLKKEHATMIGVGAMTVVLYGAARELLANYAPSINQALGDAGDDFPRLSYYGSAPMAGLEVYDGASIGGGYPAAMTTEDEGLAEYQDVY